MHLMSIMEMIVTVKVIMNVVKMKRSHILSTSYPGSFFGEGKTLVGAGHVTLTKLIA